MSGSEEKQVEMSEGENTMGLAKTPVPGRKCQWDEWHTPNL